MREIPTTDAAKAVSHPVRAAILAKLGEAIRSPTELATELNQPLGNVSWHVSALRDLGMVELVDTQPRRGALEHFYRARWRVRVEVALVE